MDGASDDDDFDFQPVGSLPDHLGMVVGSPMVPLGLPLNRWHRRPSTLSLAVSEEEEEDLEAAELDNAGGRGMGAPGAAAGPSASTLAAGSSGAQPKEGPQQHQLHQSSALGAESDAAAADEPKSEVGRWDLLRSSRCAALHHRRHDVPSAALGDCGALEGGAPSMVVSHHPTPFPCSLARLRPANTPHAGCCAWPRPSASPT